MKNNKHMKSINEENDSIIENIKIIEAQIKSFEENIPLFFQRKKVQEYNDRIKKLECVKKYLYKRLEYKIDNN